LAENEPFSLADSIGEARQRLALELRAQAEQIQKLNLELTELQMLHERTELEASRQWDAVANAAEIAAAAVEPPVSPDTVLENVLGTVRGLMTCTTPEQVFETLTEEASQWGVRAAIFDVRGRAAWGASAHGFGPALTEKVFRTLIVPLGQENPFRQVCETAGDVEATSETLKRNRNVLDKLKPARHAPVLLLPVRSAGTVAAIFYADTGESGEPLPVNALKIVAEFAGAQIDRLIALSGGFAEETVAEPVAEPEGSDASIEEPAVNPEPAAVEVQTEEALPEEVLPAELPAEPTVAAAAAAVETPTHVEVVAPPEPEPAPPPAIASEAVEQPAPPTEIDLEFPPLAVTTPQEPAQAPTEILLEYPPDEVVAPEPVPAPAEAAPEPPSVIEPPATPVESPAFITPPASVVVEESPAPAQPATPTAFDISQLNEADQKVHKDAKRFAKLLVSEIELYNKAKVADGRKNHDLYKRLKSDIDRSKVTFEKRFGKALSKQVDYFHEELVKTLAANDSAALGPEYPGPGA